MADTSRAVVDSHWSSPRNFNLGKFVTNDVSGLESFQRLLLLDVIIELFNIIDYGNIRAFLVNTDIDYCDYTKYFKFSKERNSIQE